MSRPDFDARPASRPQGGPPLLVLLLACVAGGAVVWAGSGLVAQFRAKVGNDPDAQERAPAPKSNPDGEEAEAIRLFKEARDSVVNVDTVVRVRQRRGFEVGVQEKQTGTGSGFFWDDSGRIVTNYHVVREVASAPDGPGTGGGSLRVVLADRSAYDATLVGIAPDQDLAVVQISGAGSKARPIKVGRSADLEVGQKAFAIGNPFGLSSTMTKGILSALGREIESPSGRIISDAIQTDAPINPGNSGGPLLDKDARLIGVNTSIIGPSGGNVGIGFAIPVDTVNAVVTSIIQSGRVPRADIGIRLVDERQVRRAGFAGAMVGEAVEGGPAAKAGLRGVTRGEPGDLIVAVNGEAVSGNADLVKKISRSKPGDAVRLTVERDGERREVEVTLRGV